jgi:saccharopine dehydrogenase-like protein
MEGMSSHRPVVVYAASGYTGRLVCESLSRLRIPFVAAGRRLERLEEVARRMRAEGADCVARAAAHTPAGLAHVLRGAAVVINTAGPFSLLGEAVVQAALAARCHYLDTTGEQDFLLDVRRRYGPQFARAELLLAPSAAFLWAPGAAGAELCLERDAGQTIEISYAPPSLQTVASLQSMLRTARRPGWSLEGGELARLPAVKPRAVRLPGARARRAVPVAGGEATFLLGDPRARSCETLFASDELVRWTPVFRLWQKLGRVLPGERLDALGDALILRVKKEPPPEDPENGRFVVQVRGQGRGGPQTVTFEGTSPYVTTGVLCAVAAQGVLDGAVRRNGYQSLAQAFGTRWVIERLETAGCRTTIDRAASAALQGAA